MDVFAYCARAFAPATRKAAGVWPITCPPLTAERLQVNALKGYDLLWFDLHGMPGGAHWYAVERDGGMYRSWTALTAEQVRQAELGGAVVFGANCYLGNEVSPMREAFLAAGASWVIGGEGLNYAGSRQVIGAALLGMWLRRFMAWGLPAPGALEWAKRRLGLVLTNRAAAADALAFQAFRGRPEMGERA